MGLNSIRLAILQLGKLHKLSSRALIVFRYVLCIIVKDTLSNVVHLNVRQEQNVTKRIQKVHFNGEAKPKGDQSSIHEHLIINSS